ncbi:hypothetical protein [Pseudoalteromonas aurantia]|uniref:Uncharacterized protein n=1 Tax=Pseudoalteromonas aurantia TaxID=43654 RepID=A0A5S3VD64_9GAMM|nr:hypothetical protein [Pseudoalteromonas aurantia]TMO63705.1 hypothetical protein CWC18_08050 [Pseudoalteromonas aurantia]TMO70178.1 hypothetical protein CWC19_01680 [Pseudoalteromonas aurantia]TMO77459.1 hypothetical protein CWC20_04610 [Pseudoalteromonas aurantia]
MDKEKQFEQALKQAYKKNKTPLSAHQLHAYKHACAKSKKYFSWQTVQWLLACTGLAFLGVQLFITTPVNQQHALNTHAAIKYQNFEIHRVTHGQYQREMVALKQNLDAQLANSQAIRKAAIYHGEVIEQKMSGWLIADCQRHTLISLEQSLLAQLVPDWKSQPSYIGQYLALNHNNVGQITGLQIAGPSDVKNGQQIYSCP